MTVETILDDAERRLTESGSPSPRLDAEVLLAHALGCDRARLLAGFQRSLPTEKHRTFCIFLERRLKEEPVAYIRGKKEFWSLEIQVTPDVLIPRPETEILVEETLKRMDRSRGSSPRILEIGTGSGAVSVALAVECPGAEVIATDLSTAALAVALRNVKAHGLEDRVHLVAADLLEPLRGNFDIVLSNPPYIRAADLENLPRGVASYEPFMALAAGPRGTECHEILALGAPSVLRRGGWLLMELGWGQSREVLTIIEATGHYEDLRLRKDYAGLDRVVAARLTEREHG